MQAALGLIVLVVSVVAIAVVLVVVARRARKGGVAGSAIASAMAAYDEAMHSTAHDRFIEVRQQKDRTTPIESHEDK